MRQHTKTSPYISDRQLLFGHLIDRLDYEFRENAGRSWYLLIGLILRHGGVNESRGDSINLSVLFIKI